MRFAERKRVRGLVLVSPFYESNHKSIVEGGFLDEPWDWTSIRRNTDKITIFCGDNDPWIEQEQFDFIASQLRATKIEIQGAGHFNEQETFSELANHLIDEYA